MRVWVSAFSVAREKSGQNRGKSPGLFPRHTWGRGLAFDLIFAEIQQDKKITNVMLATAK